jgi:protein-S-isoprenylcysteine O-methyltransferase Ste14
MEKGAPQAPPASANDRRRMVILTAVQFAAQMASFSLVTFLPAGRWDWPAGWLALVVYLGGSSAVNVWLAVRRPALAKERAYVPKSAGRRDYFLIQSANLLMIAVTLPLAGLDKRFGWSPALPPALAAAALLGIAAGFAVIAWAMSANDYFSALIRIQAERGHTVAEGGPYRFLRHPGYAAMIAQFLLIPVALGSLWALIPATAASGLYVVRTAVEDRTLHHGLPGYAEYARRVRYRLIPGVW